MNGDMTGDAPETTTKSPVPVAVPAPGPAAPQEPAPGDLSARAAALEAELARVRAEAIAGAKALLRVLRPHVSFTHGGITVGSEPTPVPERAVGALMTAAAEAGVQIEEAG